MLIDLANHTQSVPRLYGIWYVGEPSHFTQHHTVLELLDLGESKHFALLARCPGHEVHCKRNLTISALVKHSAEN